MKQAKPIVTIRTVDPASEDHSEQGIDMDVPEILCPYPKSIRKLRKREYPQLQGTTYLDHAGTTLYPRSLVDGFANDMKSNIFGNPHSHSPSSMLSTKRIESVRSQTLAFFKADPQHFDLVFVANATAGIKLVSDCMSDYSRQQAKPSFRYAYHRDSHTSLVGIRDVAAHTTYLESDAEVEQWIERGGLREDAKNDDWPVLFAYPAQSNMNGRRSPLNWPGALRRRSHEVGSETYTLLDAAAFVMTGQLDLSDESESPDFVVLSFYKIFGFPDLGALIVRKKSGHVLSSRRYFGGGTVDMVVNAPQSDKAWQARKQTSLHEMLEDGTPPFHSIVALETALKVHKRLFGSMDLVSRYTATLIKLLHGEMSQLRYQNGQSVCEIYRCHGAQFGDSKTQGPTIAFNLRTSTGRWIGKTEFESAAIEHNIQLRTGGVCNPGGIATALDLSPDEMAESFAEGVRCGNEIDEMHGKPTGVIRVSLGAMSCVKDIDSFMQFLNGFVGAKDQTFVVCERILAPRQSWRFSSSKLALLMPPKSGGRDERRRLYLD